jgi:hypothetical protein
VSTQPPPLAIELDHLPVAVVFVDGNARSHAPLTAPRR